MYFAENKSCLFSDKSVHREGNPKFEFLWSINIIYSESLRETQVHVFLFWYFTTCDISNLSGHITGDIT